MKNGNNWGGRREGAGRKPVFGLGRAEREQIIKDVAAAAEKKGSSIGQELGDMMFGRGKDKRLKMQAMQLFVRDVLPKASEHTVTENNLNGPFIYKAGKRKELMAMLTELEAYGIRGPAVYLPEQVSSDDTGKVDDE